jgi:hypothetical protein
MAVRAVRAVRGVRAVRAVRGVPGLGLQHRVDLVPGRVEPETDVPGGTRARGRRPGLVPGGLCPACQDGEPVEPDGRDVGLADERRGRAVRG